MAVPLWMAPLPTFCSLHQSTNATIATIINALPSWTAQYDGWQLLTFMATWWLTTHSLFWFSLSTAQLVKNAPPLERNTLDSDLQLAEKTVAVSTFTSCNKKSLKTWSVWILFCEPINVDPFLSLVANSVVLLQTFGLRWRDGWISPSKQSSKAQSTEDTIGLVGQRFLTMGAKETRLDITGK